MNRYSIVVKGPRAEAARSAVAHGAVIDRVHAELATETVLIVDSPLENLQEWVAEDLGREPPFAAGSLLHWDGRP